MLKQVPFVDLKAQYNSLAQELDRALLETARSSAFILGPEVTKFEEEFARYCQADYAIGVDSGTSALELILLSLGISSGDEVITPANTFIATALAISSTGAKPILVDTDSDTYNIDVSKIEDVISDKTKAVMPVHLYGQPADMDAICEIAQRHDLFVIEDACQAHGAKYKGNRVGSLGHAAAFSFYPSKNLGAYGDGGMVVTNDEEIANSIKKLRNYGQSKKYHHETIGFNRRLDSLQAAILQVKLQYLDNWNEARREHAKEYNRLLQNSKVKTPKTIKNTESVWHLYVIQANRREALREHLSDLSVQTGIHYPIPIHMQTAYKNLGYQKGDFPVTEEYSQNILSLPMYAEITSDQINHITNSILEFE
jgi:dTDP-4-amino-4,6-dideoxygalactose transaminase